MDEAVRAQFGDIFKPFRMLRIRRNELEYPAIPEDQTTADEAVDAVARAEQIIATVEKLLPHVSFF